MEKEVDKAVEQMMEEIRSHRLSSPKAPKEVSIEFWMALRDQLQDEIDALELF